VPTQLQAALACLSQLLIDVLGERPFMRQRRIVRGDLLARPGQRRGLIADRGIELGQRFLELL
jgi:hypothetical protein